MRKRATARTVPDSREQAFGVILEEIRSQMQVVVEAVTSLGAQFDTKLTAMEARLAARIDILEEVVRQNSTDIRNLQTEVARNSADIRDLQTEVARNSADIRDLQTEVAALRRDFQSRASDSDLRVLEERVRRLEEKLGIAS